MAIWDEKFLNLTEDSRPTLYRSLKYWGKKPHNIWRKLIEENTQIGDIVYDPFAGSALTFFEAIKIGRKPIIADINPLTLFLVEVYSKNYDTKKIINRYEEIEKIITQNVLYKNNFKTKCIHCGALIDIYNYRNENKSAVAYSYKCSNCNKTITQDNNKEEYFKELGYWKPQKQISSFTSTCKSSIKSFGGDDIKNIWTPRNLEILSYIFDLIKSSDEDIKHPLMFAFLQTLHLTTKMCALRSKKTKRPLSTSWGRPAFMFLSKNMEQNPLIQFKRSLLEKNGVLKAIESRNKYLPQYTYSTDIKDIDNVDGIVCIKDSKTIDYISASFIITDPPYGAIIQYGELSTLWNIWLENFDDRYKSSIEEEIIIKNDRDYSKYTNDMTIILLNCAKILKDNCTMILTYNSNNPKDWDSLTHAISQSGLNLKLKYIQKNKRSSEANVKSTSNLAISDYYFVLEKNNANIKKEKNLILV